MRLFLSFLTNAIWIRIKTNTLATTVDTVGKSGNLPVASFEYTFDHVADVDEDDNVDDIGEDDIYIMMKCLSVCLSQKMSTFLKGLSVCL